MTNRLLQSWITRRGLLVAGGTVIAARFVRSRATAISPITLPTGRDFGGSSLITSPSVLLDGLANAQILDASDLADFHHEHIPGARHVWWQDTMEINALWYGMVLKADDDTGNQSRRIRFLERLGIDSNRPVVVYDRGNGQSAARVCWFLTFLGLQASILDGGLRAWLGQSGPTDGGADKNTESSAPAIAPRQGFYLFAEQIASRIVAGEGTLLDLRTDQERTSGPSHDRTIPGSIALDRSTLLDGDKLLLTRPDLLQRFGNTGLDLGHPLFLLGPTAIDCSLVWLALEICGATAAVMSDGGWQEWLDTPGLPVE